LINQLLNIITACILNITIIHIVIPHFGKCSKFCLSCLILGIDGFGLFLVALFLVSHFAHVGCDIKGVVTKMSLGLEQESGQEPTVHFRSLLFWFIVLSFLLFPLAVVVFAWATL
jgi:hypothetical protein